MYFKMARHNVKKSFKNYGIYFLTLMFAVCVFYSFNSISSQQALLEVEARKVHYVELLGQIISIVSLFVSLVLGGLILYGNNFLVKKRKKELGIYMTLGMPKGKISAILLMETLMVGVVALGIGLILGVMGSQGLSLLTAKLFELNMESYTFVVSYGAVEKTIKYFALIFGVVMVFNTFQISKYELIDLLYAGRRNERLATDTVKGAGLLFGSSLLMLAASYVMVLEVGLDTGYQRLWTIIGLGCLGTYLFFKSLMGFLNALAKRNPAFYLQGLRSFTLRQMQSKIHTNVMAMTMICLMLFLTVAGLSTGLSLKNTLEASLRQTTPYDASVVMYGYDPAKDKTIPELFAKHGVAFEGSESYSIYEEYAVGKVAQLFGDHGIEALAWYDDFSIRAIPLSQYNQSRKLIGEPEEVLAEDEIIATSNQQKMMVGLGRRLEKEDEVTVLGRVYRIKDQKIKETSLATSGINDNILTLVVPDLALVNQIPVGMRMNIDFGEAAWEESEAKFAEFLKAYKEGEYAGHPVTYEEGFINGYTRQQLYEETSGITTMILFIGIYLGIIFLIASAVVLALQQLSEAAESMERYEALRKIGTPEGLINRSVFVQILFYFALPLSLACVHAWIGIRVVNDYIILYGKPDVVGGALGTVALLVVIYGGYFYVTYIGYKNAVDERN
ncbi:MAG: FtsX-like permease family protein [Cellulosilyticaceae bacterium]